MMTVQILLSVFSCRTSACFGGSSQELGPFPWTFFTSLCGLAADALGLFGSQGHLRCDLDAHPLVVVEYLLRGYAAGVSPLYSLSNHLPDRLLDV